MKKMFNNIDPCSQCYIIFSSLLAKRQNRLDCLLLANLSNQVLYLWVRKTFQQKIMLLSLRPYEWQRNKCFLILTSTFNVIKLISFSPTKRENKLECISLASLSSLELYLWVRPEPTKVQHSPYQETFGQSGKACQAPNSIIC